MSRAEQILRITTLSGWLILFLHLLATPTGGQTQRLGYFLNPSLWWLIGCGVVMTIILLASELFSNRGPRQGFRPAALGQNLILLLPLLLYLPAQDVTLSSASFSKRLTGKPDLTLLQNNEPILQPGQHDKNAPSILETEKKRIMEFPLSYLIDNPKNYIGKQTKVKGMVFYNDDLPASTFLCIRLLITCCLADASPKGILINYSDKTPPPEHSWVVVEGNYMAINSRDKDFLGIKAKSLEVVPEPQLPYLYR
ncbi:MAG: TIGR03943 family protein [Desulfobulbaceae bacterium]|nr:TIGR03943 family protein [Desulfobulbaceae bacterium]